MDDRERFFNRPSAAERTADRKARRKRDAQKDQDDYERRVREAHAERKAELERLLKESAPCPWWER